MNWIKKGLIVAPSHLPDFGFTHFQGPVALDLEEKIRVYFGSRIKDGTSRIFYVDVDSHDPRKIFYVHSKPLFDVGLPGTFDQDGVLQVSIKVRGDEIFMYYVGFSKMITVPHTCMIGMAISKDNGNTFTKFSEGPIFPISTKDPYLLGSADVIFHDDKWHMIYTSGTKWFKKENKFEYAYVLKYASSLDGINWNPTGIIAIPQESEFHAYTSPTIFKFNNQFHMYFSTRNAYNYREKGEHAYRLGYATSDDLVHWNRTDEKAGITPSDEGWDSKMICYSNIIELNGRYIMFYNGNDFGKSGLGYAMAESFS
jgi:predicted GH43/DUF377 family glycosyl hydrolase